MSQQNRAFFFFFFRIFQKVWCTRGKSRCLRPKVELLWWEKNRIHTNINMNLHNSSGLISFKSTFDLSPRVHFISLCDESGFTRWPRRGRLSFHTGSPGRCVSWKKQLFRCVSLSATSADDELYNKGGQLLLENRHQPQSKRSNESLQPC